MSELKDNITIQNAPVIKTPVDVVPKIEKRNGEVDIQRIYRKALERMKKYLPEEAVPKEPTKVILVSTDEFDGWYLGRIKGKHYIYLSTNASTVYLNEKNSILEEEDNVCRLSHELIHQVHAEQVGQEAIMGLNLDDYYPDLIPENLSLPDLIAFRRKLVRHPHYYARSHSLVSVIREGLAIYSNFYLLNQAIKEAELTGDNIRSESIRRVKEDQLKFYRIDMRLRRELSQELGKYACINPYSTGAFDIIRELYSYFKKRFNSISYQDFWRVIKSIDLDACAKIGLDSELIQQIIRKPTMIPGLEKQISNIS